MDTSDLITAILTSSVIATVLASGITAFVSFRLKNLDYQKEYHKRILEKRLEAYSYLETQIAVMKSTVLDDDGKGYHLIFAYGQDEFITFQQNLTAAMAHNIWINDQTVDRMEKLNELFFKIHRKLESSNAELIELGKENYREIAKIRNELEVSVRRDLLGLHDLKSFEKNTEKKGKRIIELE